MLYTTFAVGGVEYKLRLDTMNIVNLEKKLGKNPISVFGNDGETIPTITEMIYILHASLQPYQHNISLNDTYALYDVWLSEGHIMSDFIPVILDIYKTSGILKAEETTEESKN